MNNRREIKQTSAIIPFIPEADFYFTKGVEAFYKKKFNIAIKWIKKAIEQEPNEVIYPAQISIIYTEMGSYHLANQILLEIEDKHSVEYPECFYLMANNLIHLGLFNEAEKYAKIYLERVPDGDFSDEATELLSLLEMSFSDDEDDFEFFEEDDFLIYQETLFYHLQRREWNDACAISLEMLDQFPEHSIIKHQFHYALFFSGEQEKAIQLEEELAKEQDSSTYSITNLVIFYYEIGDDENVDHYMQKLNNIYPIHHEQALKIAIMYAHVKCYQLAYQRFRHLPKEGLLNHLEYYRYFAKTAYALNDKKKAMRIWDKACRIHEVLSEEPAPWLEI